MPAYENLKLLCLYVRTMNKCHPKGNARLGEESWLLIFVKIKETKIG